MTEKAAAAGRPNSSTLLPETRRAMAKMIGSIITSPASKNIGNPRMSETMPRANGARFSPKTRTNVSASDCAPPECSIRRPSIAPSATRSATVPSVPPNPPVRVVTMAETGMPAANAVASDTMMRARKACTFSQMMSTRMSAIAPAAMARSGAVPRVWVQSSKRSPLIQGGAASGML